MLSSEQKYCNDHVVFVVDFIQKVQKAIVTEILFDVSIGATLSTV